MSALEAMARSSPPTAAAQLPYGRGSYTNLQPCQPTAWQPQLASRSRRQSITIPSVALPSARPEQTGSIRSRPECWSRLVVRRLRIDDVNRDSDPLSDLEQVVGATTALANAGMRLAAVNRAGWPGDRDRYA